MSKIWMLTKVIAKNSLFTTNASKNKNNKSKYAGIIGIGLLLLFVVLSLCIPIVFALDSILEIAPIEKIVISIILPMAGVTTIVFSIFSVVSVFYLNKDSEHLLPMPIEARDIMISKFLVSLITEYYILVIFILPCLIGVGVGIGAGFMYYFYMIIIFLLLPIIPSSIVTLIMLLITRFTGITKKKDLFMYISMFIVLAFAFGYNYVIQNFISIDVNNIGTTMASLEEAVLPYCRKIFPFYNSASDALINFDNINGIFSLITFIAFNCVALLVIYFVGDKLYLRSLTVTGGNKKKRENVEEVVNSKKVKKESATAWLLKKEWLIVKRTPVYMLNIVVIVFLMPLIFAVSFFIGFTGGGDDTIMLVDTSKILSYLENPFVYLIIMAVAIFFTCSSVAASTSISREGNNAWFMKMMPVSYFKQINVKVLFAVIIDLLGVIIVGIVPVIMYKIPLYYVLIIFIPLVIIVILINYFNLLLDLKRPRLNWSEESAAVKQNLNSMISIFATMGVCAIFGIFAYLFYSYSVDINVVVLSSIISAVCGIILSLVIYYFYKNSSKLFNNID